MRERGGGSDRGLVERCIAGEEEAWREFVARYHPVLERSAGWFLSRWGIAATADRTDEICARVYEKLIEKDFRILRRFRWECSLDAWLVGLVRLVARNLVRGERTEREKRRELSPPEDPPGTVDPLEEQEKLLALEAALGELEETDRRGLELYFRDGKTYEQVARELGLPAGTLVSRLNRAKETLFVRLRTLLSILM